jgi:ABC-type multidrug transport system fused ATPase/permease subunit
VFRFELQPSSATPLYRQIVEQVTRAVAAGVLRDGEELLSVRAVAQEYVINPMTVSKAYSLLEAQSIVERRRGWGCLCALARRPRKAIVWPCCNRHWSTQPASVASLVSVPTKLSPHSSKHSLTCNRRPPSAGRRLRMNEATTVFVEKPIPAGSLPAIVASGLTLRYGTRTVLDNVTFELAGGSVLGLVGRNGAGKTSLLHCLLGLTAPTSGQSRVLGCPSLDLDNETKGNLGFVGQTPELFEWLRVREHVSLLGPMYLKLLCEPGARFVATL